MIFYSSNTKELSHILDNITTPYVILQYTASSSNTSKMFPSSMRDLILKDYSGDYEVSILPFTAADDRSAMTSAITTLSRNIISWGPDSPYGETITITVPALLSYKASAALLNSDALRNLRMLI